MNIGIAGLVILLFFSSCHAGGGEPKPEQENPTTVLEEFRRQGLSGTYSLLFNLRHIPKQGSERYYQGQLWGSWSGRGARTIIKVRPLPKGRESEVRLFVQNGSKSSAWTTEKDRAKLRTIEGSELFQPLYPGLVFTPFDLQMPFIYWDEYVYEGRSKLKGRRVHSFLMLPPLSIRRASPNLAGVRISVDAVFKALIKAEILGPSRKSLKTFKIVSLKKIQNQVIIKRIDLLDEVSRDKTRFTISGADLDLEIEESFFRPDALLRESLPPTSEGFEYF